MQRPYAGTCVRLRARVRVCLPGAPARLRACACVWAGGQRRRAHVHARREFVGPHEVVLGSAVADGASSVHIRG